MAVKKPRCSCVHNIYIGVAVKITTVLGVLLPSLKVAVRKKKRKMAFGTGENCVLLRKAALPLGGWLTKPRWLRSKSSRCDKSCGVPVDRLSHRYTIRSRSFEIGA